jgi:hypothetical protein
MLAVTSLLGLLMAGFALDAGSAAVSDDPADADEDLFAEDRGDPLGSLPSEDGDDTAAGHLDLADTDASDPGEGWDDLYGSDSADLLYGGTDFDGLFDGPEPLPEEETAAVADPVTDAAPATLGAEDAPAATAPEDGELVEGFDPAVDRIVIGFDASGDADPEVEVTTEDGPGGQMSVVRLDGAVICRVALTDGMAPLTADDVALVPEEALHAPA